MITNKEIIMYKLSLNSLLVIIINIVFICLPESFNIKIEHIFSTSY